jgi:hypothetical protein
MVFWAGRKGKRKTRRTGRTQLRFTNGSHPKDGDLDHNRGFSIVSN